MARLSSIGIEKQDYLGFSTIDVEWYSEATNQKGLSKGGIYLISGDAGSGKTTLAMQMSVDLASRGNKIVYLALEMTAETLKNIVVERILPHRNSKQPASKVCNDNDRDDWKDKLKVKSKQIKKSEHASKLENALENNLFIESNVPNMDSLPDFFVRQIARDNSEYHGASVIIVDSIQGMGASTSSSKRYSRLFEFCKYAKDHKITCILIGHVTKSGSIAGPKTLQHNVDCVIYIRKAMRLRPLFVPKNRFGPERHEPYSLITDKWGCLEKSKHMVARASLAYGYLPRNGSLTEVQALVRLPKFGSKAGIRAPYLPKQKLRQVINTVSSIRDVDISDLTFEVNCYLPSAGFYSQYLDFPLTASLLSSYFQKPLPSKSLFIGEIDLFKNIRPLNNDSELDQVCEYLVSGKTDISIKKVYLAKEQANILLNLLLKNGSNIETVGIDDLESFIKLLWDDILETTE